MVQTGSVSCFARNSYATDRKETPMSPWLGPWRIRAHVETGLYRITCYFVPFLLKIPPLITNLKANSLVKKKKVLKETHFVIWMKRSSRFCGNHADGEGYYHYSKKDFGIHPLNLQSNTNNIVISLVHDQWPTRGNLKPVGLEHILLLLSCIEL